MTSAKDRCERASAFYVTAIGEGDAARAVATWVGDEYIQHNPEVATGPDAFVAHFEGFAEGYPERDVRVRRCFADGPLVFLHVLQDLGTAGLWATMDVFRFDGDRIVEHWDNLTSVADATAMDGPSPRGGSASVADAVVAAVLDGSHFEGQLAPDFEHRLKGADPGADGLHDWLSGGRWTRVHHRMHGAGYALAVFEGQRGDQHTALWLLMALDGAQVAWLWGIADRVHPGADQPHSNGKFGFPS